MYAVINTGGKQYRVEEGQILRVEKLPGELGQAVQINSVFLFSDGQNISVGQPLVDNITVDATIVEQAKAKKVLVFKFKRRKGYRNKRGHRQPYTALRIDKIQAA
jgi:large subunit ribosomal protein L21